METYLAEGIAVVKIPGRVDSQNAPDLEKTLNATISSGNLRVLCDFSDTSYINSAALRVLLSSAKSLGRQRGKLALCALQPKVNEIISIGGFDQIFPIFKNPADALKALAGV